jgi:hypothetical protein
MFKKTKERTLTYEVCREEISKYESYSQLNKNDKSIIHKIKKKGWYDLISHWELPHSASNPKWTYEVCKEETSKMSYLKELQGTSLLFALKKNGWYDELTSHLIRVQHKPYTEEECFVEAKKYNRRVDFQNNSNGQYNATIRMGIIYEVCEHMGKPLKRKQHSKEEILESARKWENQRDWFKNEPSIYRCAKGYNKPNKSKEDKEFWGQCISHMEYIFKPNGYWTYDKCKTITLNYYDKRIFIKEQQVVYNVIQKEGWNNLLEHMIWTSPNGNIRYPKNYFEDKEKAKEEALKYTSRSEMRLKSRYALVTIMKNGWGDELLSHMTRHATNKLRQIYVYFWESTMEAYVGQSWNYKKRHSFHMKKGPVFKNIQKIGEQPKFKILTKRPILEKNVPKIEEKWIKHYESLGYKMLNSAPAGSLGGKRSVWTEDNIWVIVSNCNSMKEFYEKTNSNCIQACRQLDIYDKIVNQLKTDDDIRKHTGGWSISEALEESKKYTSSSEFQKICGGGYKCLRKNNLLKVVFPKNLREIKEEYYNNKDNCRNAALECKTRSEFKKKYIGFYRVANENGWIDEVCKHMDLVTKKVSPYKWNYDKLKEVVVKYNNISKFERDFRGGYKFMMKYGFREEFFPKNQRDLKSIIKT